MGHDESKAIKCLITMFDNALLCEIEASSNPAKTLRFFFNMQMSRDMTPIYLPIKVSIVEQLLCNGCVAAHSSLTFGPNLAISVRSVP